MKNIFISYSHKDVKWKDLLVSHMRVLEKQGLCKLWHDRDISLGRDWYPGIDSAIKQAHMAVLLITRDFLVSEFIAKEEIPRFLRRRETGELIVVPLFVKPCAWGLVDWLRGIQGFPFDGRAAAEGSEVEIDKKLKDFTEEIAAFLRGEKPGGWFSRVENEAGPWPGTGVEGKPAALVRDRGETVMFTRFPYRRIDLIGREMEIKDLAQRLKQSRRVLLVNGMGGIGKTEVCKTFFLDHYREYAYAGWFDWVSSLRETVVGAFTWESPREPLGETGTLEERYGKIMGFLQRLDGTALLVFDNIENPADEGLGELTRLPDTVKVIANSRSEVPGFDGRELECLSEDLCRQLFYRYYDVETDDRGVGRLVGRCARHTLTVELLARTAQNAGLRVRDLERMLEEKGFNLNEVIGEKVDTCWHEVKDRRRFFDHLQRLFDLTGVNAAELAIMVNLAVLPPVYISLGELKEWLGLGDLEAVRGLVSKGWLRREKGKIYMHPVVQEVTRFKTAPGVKDCERLIEALTDKLYVEPGENPLDKQGYVGYAAALLGYIAETHEKAATLANNLSIIYRDLGQLEKALEFQSKTVEIFEQVLAKNHPSLATSYNNVSLIYKALGQLEKALEFQLKALEIREQVLAKNHPDLAQSYNNVSMIYQDLGQLEKALEFQLKALEIIEKNLDKNHPYLASSYNNVSLIYQDLGQLEKALEFQLKALEIKEQVLAKNHPSLAASYHNLSWIYRDLQDIPTALPYAQKAVDSLQTLFPNGHPNLDIALKNLEYLEGLAGK